MNDAIPPGTVPTRRATAFPAAVASLCALVGGCSGGAGSLITGDLTPTVPVPAQFTTSGPRTFTGPTLLEARPHAGTASREIAGAQPAVTVSYDPGPTAGPVDDRYTISVSTDALVFVETFEHDEGDINIGDIFGLAEVDTYLKSEGSAADDTQVIASLSIYDLRDGRGAPLDYVRLLSWSEQSDITQRTLVGWHVIGFGAAPSDMPSTGSARYRGQGYGSVLDLTISDARAFVADATLDVSFASGAVTGSLSNFEFYDPDVDPNPFDIRSFVMTGQVLGAGFTADVAIELAAPSAGVILSGESIGAFYGPAAAEAGGVFLAQDPSRVVSGGFVAGQ